MTTEQKAREYAGITPDVKNINSLMFSSRIEEVLAFEKYNAFIAGANFGREIGMKEAFEWIPMNEKSPEVSDKPYKILAKDDFSVNDNEVVEKIRNKEDVQYVELNYTHWRPINQEDMP